jgi:hypothetical protein
MPTIRPRHRHLAIALALAPTGAFAQSAVCPGGSIALDVSVEATPHVHMQLGGRSGNFLIDTGASYPERANRWGELGRAGIIEHGT